MERETLIPIDCAKDYFAQIEMLKEKIKGMEQRIALLIGELNKTAKEGMKWKEKAESLSKQFAMREKREERNLRLTSLLSQLPESY